MELVKVQTALATTSKKDFLKECSPNKVAKLCRSVNSVPQVFTSKLPTLASVRRVYGPDFTEAYVSVWITNLVEFFQVGKKMGESQIEETATLILQDYYMLNLADINLVFSRAKKGFYGQLYDRLDGAIILTWFKSYFDERCSEAESLSQRQHDQYASGNRTNGNDPKNEQQKAFHRYRKEMLEKMAKK